MEDEVLRQTLDRLSEDTRTLLDSEAYRYRRLRREAEFYDLSGPDLWPPLCSGHSHDDEADDFTVDD